MVRDVRIADVSGERRCNLSQEPQELGILTFDVQMDPFIGQIPDKTSHVKLFGDLVRRVPETNALHVPRVKHLFALSPCGHESGAFLTRISSIVAGDQLSRYPRGSLSTFTAIHRQSPPVTASHRQSLAPSGR